MSQKLPVTDSQCVEDIFEFTEDFIKSYNDESDEGYFLEADVPYLENLHNLYKFLLFLSKRMKTQKVEKIVANLNDKTEYIIHIRRNLKQKHCEKAKLCGMLYFTIYIKTDDIYKDIVEDVETKFYTSNYELGRPLSKEKSKKVIRLMKDELSGNIMKKFAILRAKIYGYLIDDGNEDKKAKGTKKFVIKTNLKLENYKNCLEPTELENKINHIQKK